MSELTTFEGTSTFLECRREDGKQEGPPLHLLIILFGKEQYLSQLLFILYIIFKLMMQKQKKLLTEASRQNKKSFKIAESPKRVTKLKLGSLLESGKQRQIQEINEVVRHKLDDHPKSSQKYQRNPYELSYHTDMAIFKQYCDATERYEQSGISLKWPYYFHSHSSKSKE